MSHLIVIPIISIALGVIIFFYLQGEFDPYTRRQNKIDRIKRRAYEKKELEAVQNTLDELYKN